MIGWSNSFDIGKVIDVNPITKSLGPSKKRKRNARGSVEAINPLFPDCEIKTDPDDIYMPNSDEGTEMMNDKFIVAPQLLLIVAATEVQPTFEDPPEYDVDETLGKYSTYINELVVN